MTFTFLKAQGKNVGTSLVEDDFIQTAKDAMKLAEEKGCELIFPNEILVADAFDANANIVAPAVCPLTHATGETATPTGNTTTAKIDTASEKEVQEESLILVGMILNIDYHELKDTKGGKDGLKGKLRDTFAKIAGVDQAAVSLELTLGEKHHYTEDVKVYAEIQMPDADSAQSAVKSISASNVKQEVVEVAKSIPDVQASAMGELKVVCLEVKAAGTAPETAKAGTTAQAAGTERETKKGADVAASAARNSLQMKKVIWALATISLAVSL